jgi:hypothetical protein
MKPAQAQRDQQYGRHRLRTRAGDRHRQVLAPIAAPAQHPDTELTAPFTFLVLPDTDATTWCALSGPFARP